MPICHCDTARCGAFGGRDVDQRTQKDHLRADQRERLKSVQTLSQHIIDEEQEEIAQYIASLTLSDGSTEPQPVLGGRLWNGPELYSDELGSIAQVSNFWRSAPYGAQLGTGHTQRLLCQLVEMEDKITDLADDMASLSAVPTSLSREDQHLLVNDLLSQVASIDDDLLRIDSKKVDVVEFRNRLRQKLDDLYISLIEAQNLKTYRPNQQLAQESGQTSIYYSSDHHFEPVMLFSDPILQVSYFLVVACHIVLHVGRQGCNFILSTLSYLLQLAVTVQSNGTVTISPRHQKMLSDLVTDVRTPTAKFRLDSKHIIYAVCPNPKCHQTYKPTFSDNSPIPQYPSRCTSVFKNGRNCNEIITRLKKGRDTLLVHVPIKPFVYFDFKDWVANLLSRPGYEDMMDDAWGARDRSDPNCLSDIFDGTVLRDFKDPDGGLFGMTRTEGHYAFSLNLDFFNPHGNSTGRSVSCGIIALVCLNLPPHLRYKPDNMFLAGIIPGPREPPLTCINNYLRPLVDDLVDFWTPSVWFSRTFKYPNGRRIICAIAALVCDLPAARKTAGFAGHSHNFFCSVCLCTQKEHGYGNTDYEKWTRRTDTKCREEAELWKNADSEKNAKTLFNENGMRWSELLRLPYFDVAQFVVVDAMHNLFLGLIQTHYEEIVGFREKTRLRNPTPVFSLGRLSNSWAVFSEGEKKSVERIRKYLEKPMTDELQTMRNTWFKRFNQCHKRALHFFCDEFNLLTADVNYETTEKSQFTNILLDWRRTVSEDVPSVSQLLSSDERHEVWLLMEKFVTPSWISSVPNKVGTSGVGKIKADQWRTLGTVHFPVSLAIVWGSMGTSAEKGKLLDITFSLVSAILIACSHATSPLHTKAYLQYMQNYVDGIKDIFPDFGFLPNHHMSLHLCEYLEWYGPVHAWWTFPFERLIGIVQRIPSNGKPGEYEETIAKSYSRSTNFRTLATKAGCPEVIRYCEPFLQKLSPQNRGTLTTDIRGLEAALLSVDEHNSDAEQNANYRPRNEKELPDEVMVALRRDMGMTLPVRAALATSMVINGMVYSTTSNHHGNANVLVKSAREREPSPAKIAYILHFKNRTIILVRYHCRTASPAQSLFSRYPALRTTVCDVKVGELSAVTVDQIICHFAELQATWTAEQIMIAVSLSRTIQLPLVPSQIKPLRELYSDTSTG